MKLYCIIILIAVLHCGALSKAASVNNRVFASNQEEEEEEKTQENLGGINYFQATKQIFYIYNNGVANCSKETPKIPDDYVVTPGIGAHKLHLTNATWNEARNACIKEGAHLTVITSAEEEAIINKLQTEAKENESWLGIHEQFQKDDWVTTQDVPLAEVGYINWKVGEPNNNGGKEHCVTYKLNGSGMNDLTCNWIRPFVCKIYLD